MTIEKKRTGGQAEQRAEALAVGRESYRFAFNGEPAGAAAEPREPAGGDGAPADAAAPDAEREVRVREAAALRAEMAQVRRAAQSRLCALSGRSGALSARLCEMQAGRNQDAQEIDRLRAALAELDAYARGLEKKHLAVLQSETWRALEPVRRLLRWARRAGGARRFVPRLADAAIDPPPAAEMADPVPARDRSIEAVRKLEARLWGGFSRSALAELEAAKRSGTASAKAAGQAAWALARWHITQEDYLAAHENIVFVREIDPESAAEPRQYLQEAKLLCLLGQGEAARALLEARTADEPRDSSIALMLASSHAPADPGTWSEAEERAALEHINSVFRDFGLAELAKRDPAQPLTIDNLAAAAPPAPEASRRVTVIVPAYNAEATIATALRSLAEQSWGDLEVLVVDDASTDATADVAAAFCAGDRRFRLIRQAVNGGSYVCRNRALIEATGAFVTTHDADDWSHPEKIRIQAGSLARGETPYNFTAWARTFPSLIFVGTAQATRRLVSLNFSSHMLPRAALVAAGGWDPVRISGDTELIWRIEALAGRPQNAFREQLLMPDCPLSLGRLSSSSLTGSSATHVLSIHHGLRREYREASEFWHTELRAGRGRDDGAAIGRPRFPVPSVLRQDRAAQPALDFLLIGDFNLLGGTHHSAMAMLRAGLAAGRSAGILHYRRYDLEVARPLNPEARRFAWDNGVRIVAPGETLRAETVILSHPPLAEHVLDLFPTVDHARLVVVVNQMAERDLSGTSRVYDPLGVRANLVEMLGSEGLWAPISARVRSLMAADPRYPPALADTWTPLIDADEWCAGTPRWRGGERTVPVIGRHGRDHPLKWPGDRASLRAAYCAGRPCEVRFLGGAVHARRQLGRWPRNWRAEAFGASDVRDFLGDLDVFLHFPNRDYIEEFGRAPMEAMAVGVPVILPPEFEPTFGAAAVYAEPETVWLAVERLWRDEAAWSAQVAAGRAFVRETCSYDAFGRRLDRLAAASAPRAEARAGA